MISGTMPSTIAAVVIKMGRSRDGGGHFHRFPLGLTLVLDLVREFDDHGYRAC